MELTLQASLRQAFGKANKKLREQGVLPAVVYGRGKKNLNLQISAKDFEKVYRQSGESTIINLKIADDGEKKVLIHDVSRHFMKNDIIHVDFYEVDLTRKIHAKIPLHFVGVSPAAKELAGVLIKNLNELEVEALPGDLPQFIEVDVNGLKTFDDLIRISDLKIGDKVKILGHPEEVIISVQAPRSEKELLELEKPAALEEKAVIEEMAKEAEVAKEAKVEAPAEKEEEEKQTKETPPPPKAA